MKARQTLLCGVATAALLVAGAVSAQANGAGVTVAQAWDGSYVGVHLGGGAALIDGRFNPSESPGDPWDDDWGFVAGVHAGHNWQSDSFVWGLEVDVSATDFSTSACNSCVNGSERANAEIDMLASLRLRLGMPMNDSLMYITGGVAVRTGSWTANGDSGLDGGDSDLDQVGGVVGLGWERRANEHFSARLEALWYFFGENSAPPDCCNSIGTDFESNPLVIRLGGSFYFN